MSDNVLDAETLRELTIVTPTFSRRRATARHDFLDDSMTLYALNDPLRLTDRTRDPAQVAPKTIVWPLLALALGTFGIGTTEFVAMGLLREISQGIGTTIPQAGHVISAYALGVVIGAPILVGLGARLPRRALLVGLMVLFALGNLLSGLATSYHALLAARFAAGIPHGAFFGVASLVAASLAGAQRRAWAVARVLLGLTVANVVGVPAATWIGQHFGWRIAFLVVAAIGVLTVGALLRWLPRVATPDGVTFRTELEALRRPQVWLTLGVAAIGFGGMFAVYSFIAPILGARAGMDASAIPLVLAVWGLGMVAGSLAGGWLADRGVLRALGLILVANAAFLALFAAASAHPVTAIAVVFLLGTSVAIAPALQVRLMDVAPDAQTLTAALVHSAFNAANALGPWLGGLALAAGLGWTAPSWVGVGLAIGGLAILGVSVLVERERYRFGKPTSGRSAPRSWPSPACRAASEVGLGGCK